MTFPNFGDVLLRILPVDVYKEIRADLIEIYIEAYHAYPKARYAFASESIVNIRSQVDAQAIAARNHNPTEALHDAQAFFGGLYKAIHTILLLLFVTATLLGSGFWIAESRGWLQVLDAIPGLMSFVIGGPLLIALLVAILILYVRLLTFSTFAGRTINRELVIGVNRTRTREKPKLVGYLVWNSSLNGGRAIHLLAIFSVLKVISTIPGVAPYEYIREVVREHIHLFVDTDGYREAVKRVYVQLRNRT